MRKTVEEELTPILLFFFLRFMNVIIIIMSINKGEKGKEIKRYCTIMYEETLILI